MINLISKSGRTVQFELYPKLIGKACIWFAVYLIVTTAIIYMVSNNVKDIFKGGLPGIVIACIGLLYMFHIKKPVSKTMFLRSWADRLYLRNKPLFIAVYAVNYLFIYISVLFIMSLIFGIDDNKSSDFFNEISNSIFVIVISTGLSCTTNFLYFYGYYHSPEESRKQI